MGEYSGGESNRDGTPIGGGLGGRLTPGNAGEAPPADADRPQFTKEDLAHINSDTATIDAKPGPAALDAEDVAELKDLLARKVYTPEELQRHRGLTDEELASLTAKPVSKASLEQELAGLRALKGSDPKAYWSQETQARELDLIRAIESGKAAKVEAKTEAKAEAEAESSGPEGLAEIEKELADIRALRKSDRKAYEKEEVQARERQLLQALEDAKEAGRIHEAGTVVAEAVLDAVPDAEALDASFTAAFDAMTEESQYALREGLATPVESLVARPASDEQLSNFATLDPEAAALVKSWGGRAAQRLGRAHARMDTIVAGLSDADYERAGAWIDALTPQQRVGIVRALAGR